MILYEYDFGMNMILYEYENIKFDFIILSYLIFKS